VLLVAGCATESVHSDVELARIDQWLPGRYDNQAQIAADRRAGRPPHQALTLAVVPVDAIQIGHHVFYVEESVGRAASNGGAPRLVLAPRLASLDVVKGRIVAALWSFTDPPRWREGATTPELFTALQPQDVKLMHGCALTFLTPPGVEAAKVVKVVAADDPSQCQATSPLTGSVEPLAIRVELTHDEIAVSAQPGDAQPAQDASSYTRFRRSGAP
jgi:hypothetical protein